MSERKVPKIRFPGFTDDWEQRKVGTFASVLSASRVYKDEWRTEGVPFYRSSDVVSAFKGNDNERAFISTELYEELIKSSGRLEKGDILITGGGSIGIPYIVPNNEPLYSKDADLIWIKKSAEHDSQYLYAYFTSQGFREYISSISHVGTIAHYTIEQVKDTPVLLPSVAEQSAIGLFFSQLDTLITLHQRELDKWKELKKGMLQKMFPKEGESVPEIRFPGFTDSWEQRKVSEVAEIITGGTPSTSIKSYWEPKEVQWLSSGEVHKKYVFFTDNQISVEGMNHSSARMVKENSVLIALAGQGKTRGTVAINRIPLTTNQSIAAMTFDDEIVPEFVFNNLDNRYDEIRNMSYGDGARGGLNKQIVGEIVIPYTSKKEQEQIGHFFSNLDNLITLHQRECDKWQTLKKALLQQMLV